ncbi:hypothetical protein A7D17_04720 [Xanthomonas floridensis]|uniref:Uncharacterized protein n=1 Tax=Xanthomonas floridensis TaxID=1843580 RepID=A0A1A9M6S3_9XANT|nr:hypothetical protein A7D17_04720 [Xanthomonas floridensis]
MTVTGTAAIGTWHPPGRHADLALPMRQRPSCLRCATRARPQPSRRLHLDAFAPGSAPPQA